MVAAIVLSMAPANAASPNVDTGTFSDWVGNGTMVDICTMLS